MVAASAITASVLVGLPGVASAAPSSLRVPTATPSEARPDPCPWLTAILRLARSVGGGADLPVLALIVDARGSLSCIGDQTSRAGSEQDPSSGSGAAPTDGGSAAQGRGRKNGGSSGSESGTIDEEADGAGAATVPDIDGPSTGVDDRGDSSQQDSAAGKGAGTSRSGGPGGSGNTSGPAEPSAGSGRPRTPLPSTAPSAGTEVVALVAGSGTTVTVANDEQLAAAVQAARPGDTIRMAAGTYSPLVVTGQGTATAPITLTGPKDAVIDGGTGKGYTVHVHDASHWQLTGFSVTGGGKGVMTDNAQFVVLDSLDVGGTGDEAVHFRGASSDNVVQNSYIHDTGKRQPQYGEGVYLGSAKSNWSKYSGGQPDLSMRNRVLGNRFANITAENVDVKEETGGALIAGNRFDGSATSGKNYADSIVDVKGFDTRVIDNITTGQSAELKNIIETHVITRAARSGCGNTIEGNTVEGFQPTGALVAVDKKCS